MKDLELLTDLSIEELEAFADSLLAPAAQSRLDDLLARCKEGTLSAEDNSELDRLLRKSDQLTILKTRRTIHAEPHPSGSRRIMSAYIPVELQRRVRDRFANCCAYCRTTESLTATVFEFEHIVARSAGGETSYENLCLSCPMCNRYKSDTDMATDPATNTDTPLFHSQQDRWSDHFAWSADESEVVGLTAAGRATVAALKMNRAAMVRVRKMWITMGEHPPDLD